MDPIYHATLSLPPYEIDCNNRLRLSAFFRIIQDVASVHATQLGLGYDALTGLNLFWVLSWARIEIDRYPSLGESIAITTWPKTRHRMFSIRDVLFADGRGQTFGRMSTAWLLVNGRSWRITPLERLPQSIPYQGETIALSALPEKLPELNSASNIYTKSITYSDLDLYQHVNSARYVDFSFDAYPQEFHRLHQAKSLTISFRSEARFGKIYNDLDDSNPAQEERNHGYPFDPSPGFVRQP